MSGFAKCQELTACALTGELEKIIIIVSVEDMKHFHVNVIHQQNKVATKKQKMNPTTGRGRGKMLINVNSEEGPLVPSRNQWHATLKGHAVHYLNITKAIDVQLVEKMEKMKESLHRQFNYIDLGLSHDHMGTSEESFKI